MVDIGILILTAITLLIVIVAILGITMIVRKYLPVIQQFFISEHQAALQQIQQLCEQNEKINESLTRLQEVITQRFFAVEQQNTKNLSVISDQGRELSIQIADCKQNILTHQDHVDAALKDGIVKLQNTADHKSEELSRLIKTGHGELNGQIVQIRENSASNRAAIVDAVNQAHSAQDQTARDNRETLMAAFDAQNIMLGTMSDFEKQHLGSLLKWSQEQQADQKQQQANTAQEFVRLSTHLNNVFKQFEILRNKFDDVKNRIERVDDTALAGEERLNGRIQKIIESVDILQNETIRLHNECTVRDAHLQEICKEKLQEHFAQHQKIEAGLYGIQSFLGLLKQNWPVAAVNSENGDIVTAQNDVTLFQKDKVSTIVDGNDKIVFESLEEGKVRSHTYRGGKLIFEVVHSEFGMPEEGVMYSASGEVLRKFKYDSNGQVKE